MTFLVKFNVRKRRSVAVFLGIVFSLFFCKFSVFSVFRFDIFFGNVFIVFLCKLIFCNSGIDFKFGSDVS